MRDSLPVSDGDVEAELDRKVNYFISVAGSQEAFEEYYKKSVEQIKDDYREDIREQLFANEMRRKILGDIKVTPSEVKAFFEKLSKDSLPYFNAEMELSQIVVKPKVSPVQREAAMTKIKGILDRIRNGESFDLLASLYSEDIASAQEGGDLGWAERGSFVKEFEAAAFKLKNGEISDVVESPYGFHIIMNVERRGDQIYLKHILVRPQSTSKDAEAARVKIDSIRNELLLGRLVFSDAVKLFSDDESSKSVGGAILNYETGSNLVEVDKLDPDLYQVVDTMKAGSISPPVMYQSNDGTIAYRIIKLISKSEPHEANMQQDYDRMQNAARSDKEQEIIMNWLGKRIQKTYLMVDNSYKACDILKDWLK
jgi:peptidyl-prolyl cis-trans isomerase SurA